MKTIYFARHSKSSWGMPMISDFDRPLNKRGFRDAETMSNELHNRGVKLDFIFSSLALRAVTSANYYKDKFDISNNNFYLSEAMYLASPPIIWSLIRTFPKEHNVGLVIGHNPGFTDFANEFEGEFIDNIPTSGVFKVEFDNTDWLKVNTLGNRSLIKKPK